MSFNANDYIKLKKDHRIVGKLIGVAPPYPRNVNLIHLPAVYSEYETRLMLEENLIILEEKCDIQKEPTEKMRKDFEKHQAAVNDELLKTCIDNKLKSVKHNMSHIIKGKQKKLLKAGYSESEISISEEDILREEQEKLKQSICPKTYLSQVPTEHPFYSETKRITEFPVKNLSKYKVFKDLWRKKLYITNGDSFGGDFLTYSSDPTLFHASQIIHIVDQNDIFDQYLLTNSSRLSVSVKKKCVFAYVNDEDKIVYQTLEWINPKLREFYTREKPEESIRMEIESEKGVGEKKQCEM